MTTPPPDTKVQSETLEEIASKITRRWGSQYRTQLNAAILSALRNERERAANLLDVRVVEISNYQTRPYRVARRELEAAAMAIREGR